MVSENEVAPFGNASALVNNAVVSAFFWSLPMWLIFWVSLWGARSQRLERPDVRYLREWPRSSAVVGAALLTRGRVDWYDVLATLMELTDRKVLASRLVSEDRRAFFGVEIPAALPDGLAPYEEAAAKTVMEAVPSDGVVSLPELAEALVSLRSRGRHLRRFIHRLLDHLEQSGLVYQPKLKVVAGILVAFAASRIFRFESIA